MLFCPKMYDQVMQNQNKHYLMKTTKSKKKMLHFLITFPPHSFYIKFGLKTVKSDNLLLQYIYFTVVHEKRRKTMQKISILYKMDILHKLFFKMIVSIISPSRKHSL